MRLKAGKQSRFKAKGPRLKVEGGNPGFLQIAK
jgi:hypothetical protein